MPTRELLTPQAVGSLHEGCQVIDFDWRYLYVNDAVLVHGKKRRDELLGRTMLECYPGIEQTEMFATLQRVMQEREEATLVNRFTYPDGSEGFFELRFVPVPRGVCILSLDITAMKRAAEDVERLEGQLRVAAHFEAIGRRAGKVSHDVINLLSVIAGLAELISADLPDGELKADITQMRSTALSAVELTRQLSATRRLGRVENEASEPS